MEWIAILAVILVGPIVWALVAGRGRGAPEDDDALGSTSASNFVTRD